MFRSVRQSQTVNRSLTVVLTLVCLLTVALLSKGALPKLHSAANAQTDPSPLVLINLPGMAFPDSALLGEKFCYTARIVNTSSSNIPGYGPYLRLFLPPGLTLEDATLPGVSTTSVSTPNSVYPLDKIDVGVFPASMMLFDPLSNTVVNGQTGYRLWLIKAPIGSLYNGEPGIDLNICLRLDPNVALGGLPLDVGHVPVYQYGNSPVGNTAIVGGYSGGFVTPVVVKLTKSALNYTSNKQPPAPTVEIPTGSCNPITFELIANIADSTTIKNISFQDQLPTGMTLVNGSVTVLNAAGTTSTACTNYSTNFVCASVNQEQGAPGTPPEEFETRDIVVQFQAYANNNVLSATSCASAQLLNTATLDALYLGNALPQQSANLLIEVEHVTLQKTAAGPNAPADPIHVVPGDMVNYGLNFQVSQGTTISNAVITDRLPNGISLIGTPTIFCGEVPTPITPTIIPQADGSTELRFNLGTVSGCTSCGISYKGMVAQTYNAPLAGQPVLASDPLIPSCSGPSDPLLNCTTITYNIPNVPGLCSDDTAAGVIVKPVQIEKALVTAEPPEGFKPGDAVTFKLKMCIPSGDTKSIEFKDFLPSPIFKANSVFNVALTQSPNVGATVTSTANLTDNSIKFTINPTVISINPTQVVCLEVTFSVLVTTDPFADNLFLTNLFQSKTLNTQGTEETHLTGVVIHVRAPKLKITKGVFSSDNPNAVVSPTPPPSQPDPPVDGNLTGADAGDQITFYLTIKNEGGAPAYAINVKDVLPPCFKLVSFMALAPAPTPTLSSSGTLLGGKQLIFNFGVNSLAAMSTWVIKVVAKLPPHSALPPDELGCDNPARPCQLVTNSAQVQWSSRCDVEVPGQCIPTTPFPYSPEPAEVATVAMAQPTLTKSIIAIDFPPQPTPTPAATYPVVIGATVKYKVSITVPEATFNSVVISDTLEQGLAFVSVDSVTASPGLTASNGFVMGNVMIQDIGANPVDEGRLLKLDLGKVMNANTDNVIRKIELIYNVVVLNLASNVQLATRKNSATFAATECSVTATGPTLKIVEPKLQITKTADKLTADAGDVITWTMTITNASPSDATAYQVLLNDPIGPGQSFVNGSLMLVSGLSPNPPGPSGGTGNTPITALWSAFPVGSSSTIKFQTTVANTVKPCDKITNTASLTWMSRPITVLPISTFNPFSCPRTGNPADCGQLNNYAQTVMGMVPVPAPVATKTLITTSEPNTQNDNVTIGEEITYQLKVCLPEGTTPSIKVTDILEPGFEIVSATLQTGVLGPAASLLPTPGCGSTQSWTFNGPFSVPVDADPNNNCATIEMKVRVCNVSTNNGMPGMQNVLNNSFTAALADVNPPTCNSASNTVPVTVVEPKLEVKKEFTPAVAEPNQPVQIKITVTNIGTSEAYGLALQDILGGCLTFVSATSPTGYNVTHNAGVLTIQSQSNNTPLLVGATNAAVFIITVNVGDCCFVPNSVAATATNLPGDKPGERTVTDTGNAGLLVNGTNCPCVTAPQLPHLVGWWPFDEAAGATAVKDISGGHNGMPKPNGNLSFNNGPLATSGSGNSVVKGAFNFLSSPGVKTFVEVPDASALDIGTNDLTIDLWVKPLNFGTANTGNPNQPLVNKLDTSAGTGYDFYIEEPTGKLVLKLGDGTLQTFKSTTALALGQWQQVAVTVKRSAPAAVTFYINGNSVPPVSPPPVPAGDLGNTKPLTLGGGLEISLDEIEIFDVALSQAEVQTIVNAGKGGKCKCAPPPAQMVAWYPLDDKNGFTVTDILGSFNGFTTDGALGHGTSPDPTGGIVNGAFTFQHLAQQGQPILVLSPITSPLNFGTGNFSIDAWVNIHPNANPTAVFPIVEKLFNGERGYSFYVQGGKLKLIMSVGAGTLTIYSSATALGAGWQHVAVTVDRLLGGKFIINGGPVAPGDNFSPLIGDLANLEDFLIGGTFYLSQLAGDSFSLDEIEIFNSAVSLAEIKAIAEMRQLGKCSPNCSSTPCPCGSFAPRVNYNVGNDPRQLASADLDNDGDLDLAVPNGGTSNVSILLNNGAGVFSASSGSPFAAGNTPAQVAVGDFNSDFKPDLVTVGQFSPVNILLGNNNGTFGAPAPTNVSGGPDPYSVAVTDFNNDGKADLAIANLGSSQVFVLLGVGNGTFTTAPGTPHSTGANTSFLVTGDFNNDGKPDLATANRSGNNVTILLGLGNGNMTQATGSPISVGTFPRYLTAGDFNADGKLDLAVSNFSSNNISVLLGGGNGTFTNASNSPFSLGSPGPLAVKDYNNDGKLDLAVAVSSAVAILCGNGDGTFNSPVNQFVVSSPLGLTSADFNGDGKLDLAASNSSSSSISILLNNCAGTPGTFITISPASLPGAEMGTAYSQQLTQTGCPSGTATWSIATGALPNGVTLNTATGLLSGTPNTSGTFTFTVKATCANGCMATRDYTIKVCSILIINPPTMQLGSVGTPYNQTLTQTGGANVTTWRVGAGSLPNGLSLNAATGVLAGTPTLAGTFNFSIVAADLNGCTGVRAYTININTVPTINTTAVSRQQGSAPASATIANVSDPEQAANTLAVTVNSGANATVNGVTVSGLSINAAGAVSANVVAACTATTANFTLTVTDAANATNSATLTVTVMANSAPLLTYSNQVVTAGGSLTINPVTGPSDNGSLASIALQSAGAYTGGITINSTTGVVSLTNAKPGGTHTISIRITDNCSTPTDTTFQLNVTCPTITVNPATLANGFVGSAYAQALSATGGIAPSAFAVTAGSLPVGLTLASSGVLAGTPLAFGAFNFTVTATDANGCTGTRAYTLNIRARVKADFDGDGKTDLSVFRPTAVDPVPNWLALSSLTNQALNFSWGGGYAPYFDVPVPGDYDGDGKADYAIWRGADTFWYLRRSSDGQPVLVFYGANFAPYFDIPVPGDFDGDGKTDIAVFRRSGTWFIRRSSDGGDTIINHGQAGDVPLAADFDGDGKCDLGLFRPDAVAPTPNWIIRQSSTNTVVSLQWGGGYAPYFDTPVPADYDGDGKADLAIWRGADSIWYIRPSATPNNPILDLWGANYAPYFDIPTPGDYDGDGKADIAVFRRSGTWFVKRSSNGTNLIQDQGQQGDVPLPANGIR